MSTRATKEPIGRSQGELTANPTQLGESCFFFWKGRVALYAILKSLGIGAGDSVLVPGYTCVVVPQAVCFLGAKPIFVDIDPRTYNVSLDRIESCADERGQRAKVLIVQHTYGAPVEAAPIVRWAHQRDIAVVEDCCHALGSRYVDDDGLWRGAGSLGDAAFFSSQWSKPVSTGLGGWATTRSPALAEKMRQFHANQCASPSTMECALLTAETAGRALFSSPRLFWFAQATYRFLAQAGVAIGSSSQEELSGEMPRAYAKRMSAFQRWLLGCKLRHVDRLIQHRRDLQTVYEEELRHTQFSVHSVPRVDPVLLRYPVRVANKQEVLEAARRNRVELGDWFDHPLHPKESNHAALGYKPGMCPNAEAAAQQVINLPIHEHVSAETARKTVEFLKGVARPIRSERFSYSAVVESERPVARTKAQR